MPKPNLTKSKWLARAEDEYQKWEKREQFESYMAKRLPHLTKGEIKAIGQTMVLNKSIRMEKALSNLAKAEKPHAGMNRIGQTRSGKHIYASQKADSKHNKDFSSDDHADAAAAHHVAMVNEKADSKLKNHHFKTRNAHLESSKSNMNPRDLASHAEKHGVHKPASHDRNEAGAAAGARLSMNSSSSTGFEKSEDMTKALTFGSKEDQEATAKFVEEQKKNPKSTKPKAKTPDLKEETHSEVSHTTPMSHSTDEKYETVHLKSGHELHGHPKGKFKAGDKVVARPHLMGTHVMEHKK
jgi:hypothetical protein